MLVDLLYYRNINITDTRGDNSVAHKTLSRAGQRLLLFVQNQKGQKAMLVQFAAFCAQLYKVQVLESS